MGRSRGRGAGGGEEEEEGQQAATAAGVRAASPEGNEGRMGIRRTASPVAGGSGGRGAGGLSVSVAVTAAVRGSSVWRWWFYD